MAAESQDPGYASAFPRTAWSIIVGASDPSSPQYREKLGELIDRYWKPVYSWLRCARACQTTEAEDLTQEFFAGFVEHELARSASPDKGRFRTFLKVALKNFLVDRHRFDSAQKRGGLARKIPFEEIVENRDPAVPQNPDEAFDRVWKETLLKQVLGRVEAALKRSSKAQYFEIFRRIVLDPPLEGPPTYEQLATELGVSAIDVANRLAYVKHLARLEVRKEVQAYVNSPDDLDREVRELFGSGP